MMALLTSGEPQMAQLRWPALASASKASADLNQLSKPWPSWHLSAYWIILDFVTYPIYLKWG